MSIFKKILGGAAAIVLVAGAGQADTIKFGVTDITGLESLQTEYGDFVAVLEEITGDEVKFFPVNSRTAAVRLLTGKYSISSPVISSSTATKSPYSVCRDSRPVMSVTPNFIVSA